jgi:Flp pilus assembly protein TadG
MTEAGTKQSRQRGTSAIEFALVLPVLILLVFGIIEFGLLLYDQQVITNASREGVRYGIKYRNKAYYSSAQVQTRVNSYIFPSYPTTTPSRLIRLGSSPGTPNITLNTPTCSTMGNNFQITVSYPYSFLMLGNLGFTNPVLTATTVMKCE